MSTVSVAISAKLFEFDTIGIILLIFHRRVIALFAIDASERDRYAHNLHLPKVIR